MNNSTKWLHRKIRTGWVLLVIGLLIAVVGMLLTILVGNLPFNERIVTGLGIVLIGLGIGRLVPYNLAKKDQQSARRIIAEAQDERTQLLQAKAGNRAYKFSAILGILGLMWVSFVLNGSLPQLSDEMLWYFLAALVILPFSVYIGSMIYDEQHH